MPHSRREPACTDIPYPFRIGFDGTCQYEHPLVVIMICMELDGIPKVGSHLPFVYETGTLTLEDLGGLYLGQLQVLRIGVRIVHVDGAFAELLGGRGLPHPLGSADFDRTKSLQFFPQLRIDDPRNVAVHLNHDYAINMLRYNHDASWR